MKAGWEVKPLGSIAEFVMGQAPAGKDCNKEGDGVPFVKAGEFGESRPIIREWTTDPKKHARSTDVLICVVGATCGKINLGADCAIGRSAAAIRPDASHLDQFYLHYFLEGKVQKFREGSLGAAQTVISKNMLAEMSVPAPPLEEQKRIVAVLDAAFEGLTRAEENAKTNLQNARELFENSELELFNKHTGNIALSKLGDFADFRNGLNFSKNSTGQTIKIVGVGDFQDHFWMPLKQLKSVSIEGKLSDQDMIHEDDILAVRSNGNKELIGRVMLAGPIEEPTSFSGFTIRIRLNSIEVSPEFVCYFMKTKAMRKLLTAGGDGANISNLNQQLLSNLEMRIPSKDIQELVVTEAKNLRTGFDDLVTNYQTKLTDIADLRQSLLQKAFAGELT